MSQPIQSTNVTGGKKYTNLSADTLVHTGPGDLIGIFVASSSAATIKICDALTSTTPTLVNTFTAAAGAWYPLPFHFNTGLYIDITGTIDLTVSWS